MEGILAIKTKTVRVFSWRDFLVLRCVLIFFTVSYTKRDAPIGRAVRKTVKKSKDAQKQKIATHEGITSREEKP